MTELYKEENEEIQEIQEIDQWYHRYPPEFLEKLNLPYIKYPEEDQIKIVLPRVPPQIPQKPKPILEPLQPLAIIPNSFTLKPAPTQGELLAYIMRIPGRKVKKYEELDEEVQAIIEEEKRIEEERRVKEELEVKERQRLEKEEYDEAYARAYIYEKYPEKRKHIKSEAAEYAKMLIREKELEPLHKEREEKRMKEKEEQERIEKERVIKRDIRIKNAEEKDLPPEELAIIYPDIESLYVRRIKVYNPECGKFLEQVIVDELNEILSKRISKAEMKIRKAELKDALKALKYKIEESRVNKCCSQNCNGACNNDRTIGNLCDGCWDGLYLIVPETFHGLLNRIKDVIQKAEQGSRLFIVRYTHLLEQYCFEKNPHINVFKITYGSQKKLYWRCLKRKHVWECIMSGKTTNKSICGPCYNEYDRIHIDDEISNRKMRNRIYKNRLKNTTEIGDLTEQYVVDILNKAGIYEEVKRIGYIAADADVSVKLSNGRTIFIQVKTLSRRKDSNSFFASINSQKYDDDMLMVFANKARDLYSCCYWRDIKHKNAVHLTPSNPDSQWKDIMFTDFNSFMTRLHRLIPGATTVMHLSKDAEKEYKSLLRFEHKCKEQGLTYERNTTNGNTVDCIVNGKRIQAKFRTLGRATAIDRFSIGFCKTVAKNGSSQLHDPYEEKDMDHFVVEVGGIKDELGKYEGNFLIFPISDLRERRLTAIYDESFNVVQKGKTKFDVSAPDSECDHWTMKYWNRFDLLM